MTRQRQRKPLRLKGWDYAGDGVYFITICTQDRKPILWESDNAPVGQGLCPCLSQQGKVVEEELLALPQRFPRVVINKYTVMPNHVHILLSLTGQGQSQRQGQSPCPTAPTAAATVGSMIGAYKSISTKRVNQLRGSPGQKLWQFRFYDHIVRDEADYLRIWDYIEANPAKWREDLYYQA